ncbi:hypothetical protein JTE90_027226 [Oedothorax gibbosus]|uniref:Uncharacterized protein n=1 Tax=Oedothorax gibbosus TaxID=931172 RepID=A0AAV6U1J2_9ARAC|nr:hypothetical protein JTE90_027226 [Oedothorax gibbosus]
MRHSPIYSTRLLSPCSPCTLERIAAYRLRTPNESFQSSACLITAPADGNLSPIRFDTRFNSSRVTDDPHTRRVAISAKNMPIIVPSTPNVCKNKISKTPKCDILKYDRL